MRDSPLADGDVPGLQVRMWMCGFVLARYSARSAGSVRRRPHLRIAACRDSSLDRALRSATSHGHRGGQGNTFGRSAGRVGSLVVCCFMILARFHIVGVTSPGRFKFWVARALFDSLRSARRRTSPTVAAERS